MRRIILLIGLLFAVFTCKTVHVPLPIHTKVYVYGNRGVGEVIGSCVNGDHYDIQFTDTLMMHVKESDLTTVHKHERKLLNKKIKSRH